MKSATKTLNYHSDDFNKYVISFGSIYAKNKIEIFYSMECGLSREFLQKDLFEIFEQFLKNGAARLILYPAGLDNMTACFASKIKHMNDAQKRDLLIQVCKKPAVYMTLDKAEESRLENTFFDITKILGANPGITETLMTKINEKVLINTPSTYNIGQMLSPI